MATESNDTMSIDQYRRMLESTARETGTDVRQIKTETGDTSRDVQTIKDDVAVIRDQLSTLQQSQRRTTASPKKPVFNTRRGANTLTGVSLNEIALRIKAQSPQMSYSDALKAAKPVKEQNIKDVNEHNKQLKQVNKAKDTLETGGGSFIGNLKRNLLTKTLGENLGTKASRFLTSKATQDKAAQTILNFDAGKAKRIQEVQPVEALSQQVHQLSAAVKNNTAVKVEAPEVRKPLVREDLSETVAALKVLGYDIKEIKERLSTLPRGLSTEDRIKHALKSSSARIAARDAHEEVAKAIKAHEPTPVATSTPAIEPKKPEETKPPSSPVNAVRGAIPVDQLSSRKKEEAKSTTDAQKAEQEGSWKTAVTKKLYAIQDGLNKLHSESFIGLLAVAVGAIIAKYWEPIKATIGFIWKLVSSVFQGIESLSDWMTTKILDFAERISPSDKTKAKIAGMMSKIGGVIGETTAALSGETQETRDEIRSELTKDQNKRDNKEKLYDKGYDNRGIESLPKSAEEAFKRHMPAWYDEQYGEHNVGVIQRSAPKGVTPDTAPKMDKQIEDNTKLKSDTTGSVVVMPTHHTVKTVPVSVGGDSGNGDALAILAARNTEESSQSYIGSIFNHPATYGPLGRV